MRWFAALVVVSLAAANASAQAPSGAHVVLPGTVAQARARVMRAMQDEGFFIRDVAACDCVIRSEWNEAGRLGLRALVATIIPRGDSVEVQITGRVYSSPIVDLLKDEYSVREGEIVAKAGGAIADKVWVIVEAVAKRVTSSVIAP